MDFFAPIGIVVGAAAVIDGGAFLGVQASVGASYSLGAAPAVRTPWVKPEKTKPEKLAPEETPKVEPKPTTATGGLTLKPSFDYVFPVFRDWYSANPLGTLVITNGGKDAITDLRVSFYMKQFMDGPWTSDAVARLEPGKEVAIPIKALFTQEILDINSSIKSLGEFTIDYKAGSEAKQAKLNENVRLQGRNEMTWADDDRPGRRVRHRGRSRRHDVRAQRGERREGLGQYGHQREPRQGHGHPRGDAGVPDELRDRPADPVQGPRAAQGRPRPAAVPP